MTHFKDVAAIDEIACEEYGFMLEDKAITIEDKAVEAYKTANDKAIELNIKNEWQQKTLEALNRLRSDDFPMDNTPLESPLSGNVYAQGFYRIDGGAPFLKTVMNEASAEEAEIIEEPVEGEDAAQEQGAQEGQDEATEEADTDGSDGPGDAVDDEADPVDEAALGEIDDDSDDAFDDDEDK